MSKTQVILFVILFDRLGVSFFEIFFRKIYREMDFTHSRTLNFPFDLKDL